LFLVSLYNASAIPINTSAEILTRITIPEQTPFDLGSFTVDVVGGTFTLDAGGTISSVPDITLLGGHQGGIARLVTAGAPALATITVTVIGTSLASYVRIWT
jgi:hypothetical protein